MDRVAMERFARLVDAINRGPTKTGIRYPCGGAYRYGEQCGDVPTPRLSGERLRAPGRLGVRRARIPTWPVAGALVRDGEQPRRGPGRSPRRVRPCRPTL